MIKTGMPSIIGKASFSCAQIRFWVALSSDKSLWQLGQAKEMVMCLSRGRSRLILTDARVRKKMNAAAKAQHHKVLVIQQFCYLPKPHPTLTGPFGS